MNKTAITSIIILILVSVPISVCIFNHPDTIIQEKRKINPFPCYSGSLSAKKIKRFFRGFESYYNDRILGRSTLLWLSNLIYEFTKTDKNSDKCYRGRENWLFLGNDYDRCVDALTGRWKPSAQQLANQLCFFSEVEKIVHAVGAEFHILIGPNKSTIYPEYLPPVTFPAKERCITPAVEQLKARGISIFDPTEFLLANKNKGLLYFRSDTHWNSLGAKMAFKGFLEESKLAVLPSLEFIPQKVYQGDLINIGGYTEFPLTTGDNFAPRWLDSPAKNTIDKTVLVLGDSFSNALMFYLGDIYKSVHKIHYAKLVTKMSDMQNLIKYIQEMKEKPNIVLWVQVERAFVHWGTR